MRFRRPGWILIFAVATAGCRAAGNSSLTRPDSLVPRTSETARQLVAEHNRNAEQIQSLRASSVIAVSSRRLPGASVDGKLALERPRNFKLTLTTHLAMSPVADIGSNDREFWFWVQDSPEKAIYYCNYDEQGSSALATSLQPDWIIEAMGLRIIPEEDVAGMSVKSGDQPGTLVLTQQSRRGPTAGFVRETVITESTRRIKSHRIYSPDRKVLLAQATVTEGYLSVGVPQEDGQPATVFLPKRLKLEWFQEKLSLNVLLKDPKVNQPIDAEQRAELFIEPDVKGCSRVSLSRRAGVAEGPAVRETRPVPPSGVQLGEPTPLGADDTRRGPRDPVALSADLGPAAPLSDQIVRPTIPKAPESEFERADAGGWRNAAPRAFEP